MVETRIWGRNESMEKVLGPCDPTGHNCYPACPLHSICCESLACDVWLESCSKYLPHSHYEEYFAVIKLWLRDTDVSERRIRSLSTWRCSDHDSRPVIGFRIRRLIPNLLQWDRLLQNAYKWTWAAGLRPSSPKSRPDNCRLREVLDSLEQSWLDWL